MRAAQGSADDNVGVVRQESRLKMLTMRRVVSVVVLGAVTLLLGSGCESLEPVNAQRTLRGLNADKVTVLVPKNVIGRAQDVRLDLPPGKCTPYASNEKGVFFKSDKPLFIRSWVVIAPRTVDGGVFVPNDPAEPCKPFYIYEGRPTPVQKAQEAVTVTLVDSSTNQRVSALLQ
jgi:hypothetical protein